MTRQTQAYFYALGAVLLWSTVATAFKLSLQWLDVLQLLFVSSATATLCLLFLLVLQGKLARLADLTRSDLVRLMGFGLLNPFLYYLVLFRAYELLPAQIAQSLNYTWAITLMFLSIPILKHRVSRYDVLATLICYAGVLVICLGGAVFPAGKLSIAGISLALGSTIIWALYWLYKSKDPVDPVIGLFMSFLFSLPFVSLACYLFSDPFNLHIQGLLGGIYVGLFEMGITFVLWLSALQRTSTVARVSTLIYCSPFLSLLFIHSIVGEPIAGTTVAGLLLIVAGLIVQRRTETGTSPLRDH